MYGIDGATIEVRGDELLRETEAVRAVTGRWWDSVATPVDSRPLALLHGSRTTYLAPAHPDTVRALLEVLAEHDGLRRRLAEPDRAEALAHDLRTRAVTDTWPPENRRGWKGDVRDAMDNLGYWHRNGGRPLSGDALPPGDQVVSGLGDRLRERGAPDVGARALRRYVDRHYLSVAPWPFMALTDDAPPPSPG